MKWILWACIGWSITAGSGPRVPAFLEDPDAAFALAKKTGKPLLIDFYGIWCPPCQEMDEMVFEGKTFLQKAKDFVLLKIDVDKESSWALKDKYAVGGYPTYVFTTPTGEEIHRVIGYRDPKVFAKVMDLVLHAKGKGLNESCKSDDLDDVYRCAVICGERKDMACAKPAWGRLVKDKKTPLGRRLEAKTFLLEQDKSEKSRRLGYLKLMGEHPAHPLAMVWSGSYFRLVQEGKEPKTARAVLSKAADNVDKMVASSELGESGLTQADVMGMAGDIRSRLGEKAKAKALWLKAAKKLDALASSLPKGSHKRGFAMERIYYLKEGGRTKDALALAEEYRQKFPEEFTFHYQTASLLFDMNQPAKAIPVAQKAFTESYGDNRIRTATLLVKLHGTVPDAAQAKEVYNSVKGKIKPASKLNVRTHRYLLQLDQAYIQVVLAAQKKG